MALPVRTTASLFLGTVLVLGAELPGPPLDPALKHLSQALTFRTVSTADPGGNGHGEFLRFHAFLRESFPLVHRHLAPEIIGQSALLYHWRGTQPSQRPILLLAHQDVAAVEEATRDQWQVPPFSGAISGGYVWGRGARDFKPGLMAILVSAEALLQQGFTPERDIYLAFGDDEERQGYEGAGRMAERLAQAGVKAEFILDEGGGVLQGTLGGIDPARPVAFISVAEKGYLSVDLTVEGPGGHSALPPRDNPILILGQALQRLEAHPFPSVLQEPVPSMLRCLGQGSGFWKRFVFTNLWLTGGITRRIMSGNPSSAAMLKTTMAVTRFESGVQDNVIPGRASAVVNLRLLPGWTIPGTLQHLREAIHDPRVRLTVRGKASEAPPVTPVDTPAYRLLSATIQQTFPGALVAPFLTNGATDIRHYAAVSRNLYRFAPSLDTRTFSGNGHAVDERLPVENYRQYLAFYTAILRDGSSAKPAAAAH